MTKDELKYIEDVLCNEKHFYNKCNEIYKELKDIELKKNLDNIIKKHKEIFQSLYKLL